MHDHDEETPSGPPHEKNANEKLRTAHRALRMIATHGDDRSRERAADALASNGEREPIPQAPPDEPGFACAARRSGSAGGELPQDCAWPGCGCDPRASRVLAAILEEDDGKIRPDAVLWQRGHGAPAVRYRHKVAAESWLRYLGEQGARTVDHVALLIATCEANAAAVDHVMLAASDECEPYGKLPIESVREFLAGYLPTIHRRLHELAGASAFLVSSLQARTSSEALPDEVWSAVDALVAALEASAVFRRDLRRDVLGTLERVRAYALGLAAGDEQAQRISQTLRRMIDGT